MRLLVVRAAHFLHEIFSEQLCGARRQGSEAERDDMRGEIVGAKNVARGRRRERRVRTRDLDIPPSRKTAALRPGKLE